MTTTTITPRVFSTRRVLFKGRDEYEKLANLIKKYGCVVSKVSDGMDGENGFWTAIYFDIPIYAREEFIAEELSFVSGNNR